MKQNSNDVRAACSVTLAHWNVLEATEDIIQASQTMQKEDLFWMCYSLAKLRTPASYCTPRETANSRYSITTWNSGLATKEGSQLRVYSYISRDFRGCKMRVSALWLSLFCLFSNELHAVLYII